MTKITPGIDFLAPYIAQPVLFTLAAKYLRASHHLPIPTWIVLSVSILSAPLISAAKVLWKSFVDRRAAALLGARLPPVWEGKWIANVDIMMFVHERFDIGYPGMFVLPRGVSLHIKHARR
jgi:hypothetical protein